MPILLFATILSLISGLFLRGIEHNLLLILPLIVILPALNGMIGEFGIIMVSKFTTALYAKKITKDAYHSHLVKSLYSEIIPIAIFSAIYIAVLAVFVTHVTKDFEFTAVVLWKIIGITLITTLTIILFVFLISISGGLYVYKRNIDPDDVLIPIITSIADLGSMIVFTILVKAFF